MLDLNFKVYLKTKLTPTLKIYDSSESSENSIIKNWLNPEITITDLNDKIIYKYGTSNNDNLFPYIIMGIIGLIAIRIIWK